MDGSTSGAYVVDLFWWSECRERGFSHRYISLRPARRLRKQGGETVHDSELVLDHTKRALKPQGTQRSRRRIIKKRSRFTGSLMRHPRNFCLTFGNTHKLSTAEPLLDRHSPCIHSTHPFLLFLCLALPHPDPSMVSGQRQRRQVVIDLLPLRANGLDGREVASQWPASPSPSSSPFFASPPPSSATRAHHFLSHDSQQDLFSSRRGSPVV